MTEHSFDWKGLAFVLKWTLLVGLVLTSVRFGLPYAQSYFPPQKPVPAVGEPRSFRTNELTQTMSAVPGAFISVYSSTTPARVIAKLTIPDAVPSQGKFIAADLVHMELSLYRDGSMLAQYPILTKGRAGTPFETPSGFYSVIMKSSDVFNANEQVHMPYSMQFYGNYFIHGWPYYPDGTPVASTYSGGCIRLSTDDAAKVYAFADAGVPIFVYDAPASAVIPSVAINPSPPPAVSAQSYLVADLDTGDVYLERAAETPRAIASLTKLTTALVANETIMFFKKIAVSQSDLMHGSTTAVSPKDTFAVGDLLYPLLMESNNAIADDLAQYYSTYGFIDWMNSTAQSLGMTATQYADPSGRSNGDVSTADDLFRLTRYIADKKSFIFKITRTPQKTITAQDGRAFHLNNFNLFSGSSDFIGGKVGKTGAAGDTMLSVFSIPANGTNRRVAIIVLKSDDYASDTKNLATWISTAMQNAQAACAGCTLPTYRKIGP